MNKKVPFAVIAGALAASALVAPISGAAQAPAQVESGLYFTNPEGGNGAFYSFTKWASLTPTEQSNLVLEYKPENIKIFNKVEDKLASLSATVTAESFDGAATAYTEGDIEGTFVDATTGDKIVVAPVVEEVTVESVMAINDVTVAFGEETAQEILAGLPTTVTATLNDEEATDVTLDVEWAADANYDENVAGVYTFTGTVTLPADVDYTISEELSTVKVSVTVEAATEEQITAAITDVNEAGDAASLLTALQSPVLGLKNVDENVNYTTEITNSFTNTVAQIQSAVDRANAKASENVAKEVKAVNEATGPVGLLKALDALGIENVIGELTGVAGSETVDPSEPSLAAQYFTAISKATTDTKAQIQAVIDEINLAEVTKLVVAAEKSVKASDVDTAQDLLDAYKPEDAGEVTTKADFQDRLDVVSAIAAVNAADRSSDGNALLAALKDADLELKNVADANVADYKTGFDARVTADANFKFTSVSGLQSFVNKVNADKAAGLINTVNTTGAAADAGAFATAITATGVTTVAAGNANDAAYLAAFKAKVAANSKFKFNTVDEIKAFVKAVNTAETEKSLVEAVNEATAGEIVDALTAFVGQYNNDAYLNLGSANGKRNEVARLFRGIKADTTYETKEEVQTALTSATEQYNTALNNVLNSKSISEARTTLQAVYDLALTYFTEEEIDEIDGSTVTIEQAEALFEALETERAKETPVLPKNFDEVLSAANPASNEPEKLGTSVAYLIKNDNLTIDNGVLKASFQWGSIDGIGVETDTITRNDYVYSKEGTYLRFTVKDSFGNAIPFSDVFTAMTLQTGEGPVDSIQGTNPGRQFEDWNNTAATNGFYTKLHGNEIEPYVYYGLTQSGRTTTETRTVNFPANTTRAISLSLTTKEGVTGSYTISVEVMQQTTDYATEDNLLGSANYTFGI